VRWSHYQEAIFQAFEHSADSLLIEAVAGSGKTTVLVELARIMRERMPGLRGCFMAFNKSIATTLQERIGRSGNVVAMTLHSAGWAAWRRAGGLDWTPGLDEHKVSGIMRKIMTWEERKRFEETTRKLVGFAKGVGLVPSPLTNACTMHEFRYDGLVRDEDEVWRGLIEHYGLDEDECNIGLVRKVLAMSIEQGRERADYDDMLYLPVISGVPFDRYDVVLVDEAQDVSGIQMEMISRMTGGDAIETQSNGRTAMSPTAARVIAVGDRNQAIYGFRGAGTDSMDMLRERFGMRELPLSVSYRCPVSVVQHARQWVPQVEWSDGAPDGVVLGEDTDWRGQSQMAMGVVLCLPACESPYYGNSHHPDCPRAWCDELQKRHMSSWSEEEMREYSLLTGQSGISKWRGPEDFQPGDAILCRLTRPLIEAAFGLIRRRVACRVLGRDIGAGLVSLVRKPKFALDRPVSDWERWKDVWLAQQLKRLAEKRQFAAAGNLQDRVDTVICFIDELYSRERAGQISTIGELIASIEGVFRDKGPEGMVTLSTIHKFKGSEARRVFILDASKFMPVPWGRGGGWESQQEINCMYIAATRASLELRYITSQFLKESE
jgi:superfamily I DNA/RNA helicase